MRKTINPLLIAIISLIFASCDFLETTPTMLTPETYFTNESELSSFLTTVYAPLNNAAFYGEAYPLYISGDDLGTWSRNYTTPAIICAQGSPSNPTIVTFWRILYDGINRANMLLENADKPEMNEGIRLQLKSEARFLRAFYYYTLIQNFGDVPFRTSTPKDINKLFLPRTDRQIIYDFVISEMISAEPYLLKSNQLTYTGRATQSAAQGIIARVYLFRAGEINRGATVLADSIKNYFTQARDWALKVKDSNIHGLVRPYCQVFIDLAADKYNSTGVLESIWEAEMAGNRQLADKASGRIGNTYGFGGPDLATPNAPDKDKTGLSNPGYAYHFVNSTTKLFNIYLNEKDTSRGDWNIAPFAYTTSGSGSTLKVTGKKYYYGKMPINLPFNDGFIYTSGTPADTNNYTRPMAKYRREYETYLPKDKNHNPENFPILRYSDVLLMIAEAENELNGPTALAKECIDLVRRRANLPDITESDKDKFREIVKNERAMELCFEALRRNDLIRWGDYLTAMSDLANSIPTDPKWPSGTRAYSSTYFNITPAYLFLPIPTTELTVNKSIIENNPGW